MNSAIRGLLFDQNEENIESEDESEISDQSDLDYVLSDVHTEESDEDIEDEVVEIQKKRIKSKLVGKNGHLYE